MLKTIYSVSLVLLLGSTLLGHDFWIRPAHFNTPHEQSISFELRVGDHFDGQIFPRVSTHIERFVAIGPDDHSVMVAGTSGRLSRLSRRAGASASPAGYTHLGAPGKYVVVYQSTPSWTTMTPHQFQFHLAEEQVELPFVDATKPAIRETFSRCAKTLVRAGKPGDGEPADRLVGLTLELVAEADPDSLRSGEKLPIRLYYRGQPLAGLRVTAMSEENPGQPIEGISDQDGRVFLALDRPGVWLVRAMKAIPPTAGSDADLESFWASLTFQVPSYGYTLDSASGGGDQ